MLGSLVKAFSSDPFETAISFKEPRRLRIDRSSGQPVPRGLTGHLSELVREIFKITFVDFHEHQQEKADKWKKSTQNQNLGTQAEQQRQEKPAQFEAAIRGNVQLLEQMVRSQGVQLLSAQDPNGNTLAHWASLANCTATLNFIASHGRELCLLRSNNESAQLPIHWAAAGNSLESLDLLLKFGTDLNSTDARKLTPLIIASQRGHAVIAARLMALGAKLSCADCDGDNALHWAASKGDANMIQLLIYSGFNPQLRDAHGQTPLHLACLSGNYNAVHDLCRLDRVDLHALDKNGRSPLSLAEGRRHTDIVQLLQFEQGQRQSMLAIVGQIKQLILGNSVNSRQSQLTFGIVLLFCAYPAYRLYLLPHTGEQLPDLHIIFQVASCLMCLGWLVCSCVNPGFVPQQTEQYELAMRNAATDADPLRSLCHSCRTVRPLRAKHCRICNRCVMSMDHHCPYVFNCVAANNRHWYCLFVTMAALCSCLSLVFVYHSLMMTGLELLPAAAAIVTALFAFAANLICTCMWYHAAVNLTTNESVNRKRYAYLHDARRRFRNPFDRGLLWNLAEFFRLRRSQCEISSTGGHV